MSSGRAAVAETAGASKRKPVGVEPGWPDGLAGQGGTSTTSPQELVVKKIWPPWNRREQQEPDRLGWEFVESTTKKSSVRGTDDEISPYRRLTELISSVPRISRVSSVPRSRSARSAPGVYVQAGSD
ncbi:hypothetical protein PGTUg99_037245 [Puccinia graminis f. sp. tritici]|uniref:Uncharacterized protein n=1 Tax=Puccinia graminis f. sp. tritici TaxID=56615 RepID=A0A5B0SFU3_PUCGR|nr:hypothetical protein PGTUg99_037245 [Puccinia graminis f. sp. tritici]